MGAEIPKFCCLWLMQIKSEVFLCLRILEVGPRGAYLARSSLSKSLSYIDSARF